MVRTAAATFRASGGRSAKAGKSSSARGGGNTHSSSNSNERGSSGGNSICHRDTPSWQKPITNFFIKNPPNKTNENCESSTAIATTKENVNETSETSKESNNKENGETQQQKPSNLDDGTGNDSSSGSSLTKMDATKESVLEESDSEDLKNKKVNAQSSDECNVPPKKPKLDFYKHLEEIENMSP